MIGKSILHYNIIEKLGGGGMGEVYLAEDTKLNRKVALKFLPKKFCRDPIEKKRFMGEARSSSGLDHANICVIYDVNETDDGQLFISMNYCKGENLQDYMSKNDLTIKRIVKFITQIAKGLEKAHKNKIVHCDIKPSNIIITKDKVAKIVDFGIAKIASQEKLIKKDRISGTIAYMSPEQVGNSEIDARSDIWSLGVIFYEMLTKRTPFEDNYFEALMYSIINEEPPSISSLNPIVPHEIVLIVEKMLEKSPDDRYGSINDLLSDLKNYGKIVAVPENPIKYLKEYLSNKKNMRNSIVFSTLLTVSIISIVYLTSIQGSNIPSIGILDMENLGDPNDNYWSRGITEDLIVNVASAGVIRVPTLKEVNKCNSGDFNNKEIAEKLRVDYLMSSSLFKKDSTFDLWCRITDPKSGKDVFAKKWSKSISEVSSITTILAGTILNNLGISANDTKLAPVIVDPDAYEYYLKGKSAWEKKQTNNDIELSRGLLLKALEINPNFLLAKMQLGQTHMGAAEYLEANKLFNESLSHATKIGDERSRALAMYHLGNISLHNYETNEATNYYNDALKIVRKIDDKFNEIQILRNIGGCYYWTGKFEQAIVYFNESRVLSSVLNDKLSEGEALNNIGSINISTRNYQPAIDAYQESRNIFQKLGNKSHYISSTIGLSYGLLGIGKIEKALDYAELSLKSSREISDKRNEIYALSFIGEIYYCLGNNNLAYEYFSNVSDLSREIDEKYYYAISKQFIGQILSQRKLYDDSVECFYKSDSVWKILNDPSWSVLTSSTWGLVSFMNGDTDKSNEKIIETESILQNTKPFEDYAICVYYNLYKYYDLMGDTTNAKKNILLANSEMNDRIKYIQNPKNKQQFLNNMILYKDVDEDYKKYFK